MILGVDDDYQSAVRNTHCPSFPWNSRRNPRSEGTVCHGRQEGPSRGFIRGTKKYVVSPRIPTYVVYVWLRIPHTQDSSYIFNAGISTTIRIEFHQGEKGGEERQPGNAAVAVVIGGGRGAGWTLGRVVGRIGGAPSALMVVPLIVTVDPLFPLLLTLYDLFRSPQC